eukprot:6248854-Amphidinium_carterae.1
MQNSSKDTCRFDGVLFFVYNVGFRFLKTWYVLFPSVPWLDDQIAWEGQLRPTTTSIVGRALSTRSLQAGLLIFLFWTSKTRALLRTSSLWHFIRMNS